MSAYRGGDGDGEGGGGGGEVVGPNTLNRVPMERMGRGGTPPTE